jgi:transcriptional regulator with XRE-family HTH domain
MPKLTGPSDRIRTARLAARLTQVELAQAIGVHPQTISMLERDERALTADMALKIASATKVDPEELLPELEWRIERHSTAIRLVWEPGVRPIKYSPASPSDAKAWAAAGGTSPCTLAEVQRVSDRGRLTVLLEPASHSK